MFGRAYAGVVERDLHGFLVAEAVRLFNGQAVNAKVLAQLGREHDARFPQAFDAIELPALEAVMQLGDDLLAVPQGANLDVL